MTNWVRVSLDVPDIQPKFNGEKGRIGYPVVNRWSPEQLGQSAIEIPVYGEIGVRENTLPDLQADSADCTIVVTAMNGHQLISAHPATRTPPSGTPIFTLNGM